MTTKKLLVVFFLLAGCDQLCAQQERLIIPEPAVYQKQAGAFVFTKDTRLIERVSNVVVHQAVLHFIEAFQQTSGFDLDTVSQQSRERGGTLWIDMDQHGTIPPEGYSLDIQQDKIKINAASPARVFYALQTLTQLLPLTPDWRVPCGYILDFPQYGYRGMHLDVSRHFFDVAFIKRYLDFLARYKLNVFHWHLTDSHGWRMQIDKYPKLTSVGGWRADRSGIDFTVAPPTDPKEPATYGGFYTKEDIREVIQYAAERFITVIPEIEMPGHCTAALVAYPQFACPGGPPLKIPCGYPGDLQHNFCVGNDSTLLFLEDILKEVMELFPSKYIHIGGDEVRKEPWEHCPLCQKRIATEKLGNEKGLQAWFTHQIDQFVTAHGKQLIGWDEILEAGISPNATVMSWRGKEGGLAAAAKGHQVVMAPYRHCYFDLYQSDAALEPFYTYAPVWLDAVYAFEPVDSSLNQQAASYILGGQACLWTENIASTSHAEYMLLPRLLALSEALWTPTGKKNYTRFISAVEQQFGWFDKLGINYSKSLYNVHLSAAYDNVAGTVNVTMTNQAKRDEIRYSLDGTIPNSQSLLYKGPIKLTQPARIRVATFRNEVLLGKETKDTIYHHIAMGKTIRNDAGLLSEITNKLCDGIAGSIEPYDGRWVAMPDSSVSLLIDLGSLKPISKVSLCMMVDQVGNISLPEHIEIGISTDSTHYETLLNKNFPKKRLNPLRHMEHIHTGTHSGQARYVCIHFIPNVKTEEVKKQFFVDEITVN
ncbi:hexosaminidase [bacterium A37T11]|nr:hexosaminidase [bacterium A37T11]